MGQLVTLDLFEAALKASRRDGVSFMLIGGLCVGLWSKKFGVYDWPGETIHSKDIDLRGPRAAAIAGPGSRTMTRSTWNFSVACCRHSCRRRASAD